MDQIRASIRIRLASPETRLVTVLVVSLAIYALAFVLPANLLRLYQHTRLDGHLLQDAGTWGYVRMIVAFVALALLYIFGLRAAGETGSRAAWLIVLLGTIAFIGVLLFMAPFDALDIYDNIFHGRIVGIYAANPYQQLIAQYPADPFFGFPRWKTSPSAYGPVWEMLAGLTARLAGDGILANVFAFKLLPGVFQLASTGVVFAYLRRTAPAQALAGMLLLGWNPVVLYETWGNGHNDVVMIFWILLAALLIQRKRYTSAILALVIGTLIKFIPVLLVPLALLTALRGLPTLRARSWFLLKTSLASLLTILAGYFRFWNGPASLSITRRTQMFTTSVPSVAVHWLMPKLGFPESARVVSYAALGVLAAFTLFQLYRAIRSKVLLHFPSAAFSMLAFYLMVTCLWFQQWYSIWLIGLAPLLSGHRRNLALAFGFWVLSKQFLFGPLIVPTMAGHPNTTIWLEPLLTISVLGLPWIYALVSLRGDRQTKEVSYAA